MAFSAKAAYKDTFIVPTMITLVVLKYGGQAGSGYLRCPTQIAPTSWSGIKNFTKKLRRVPGT